MPTAPFILPSSCTEAICARAFESRTATLAISLPTVVGLAVWPCVRESIDTSANWCAISRSLAIRPSMAGSITFSRAAWICRAWLVLLMSSLVQAKCTNSAAASSSGRASNFDLIQYSTAFTSWLVVFSMSLMASASASEKWETKPSRYLRAPPVSGLNSAKPQSDSAMNHATSTCTRRCM
ncbi:hypothetical protein D9M68_628280 [compost metagenome]